MTNDVASRVWKHAGNFARRWQDREAMQAGRARGWCVALALLAGCAGSRDAHKALLADRNPSAHTRDLELHYQIRSPDVLAVEVAGRPDLSSTSQVSLDGRALLGGARLAVDGCSAPQVAREVASRLAVPPSAVRVRVAKHASQHLYLFGEVGDKHHVVAYQGPETIVDLLQRLGGASPDAALSDVHVVRPHVADGKPPEVFHVDLHAILTKHDLGTNIRLEPFDRVHVGETRTKRVSGFMPPWFQMFCKQKGDGAVASPGPPG
jgi:protein involved in polysaccharide export with SLBB domain